VKRSGVDVFLLGRALSEDRERGRRPRQRGLDSGARGRTGDLQGTNGALDQERIAHG
jgi:hypothetical protein